MNVGTIPSRNWKQKLDPQELKKTYLKLKNKNPFVENRKVHYLWFNYLRLCMNLEKIGYVVKRKCKRGSKPPIYEEFIKVEVNREIYKDWSLDSLYDLKFHEWYSNEKNLIYFKVNVLKLQEDPSIKF